MAADNCGNSQQHDSPKRGMRRVVSFSNDVVCHEIPKLAPSNKRIMFYDQSDFRRFQAQERHRQDKEAADALLSMMAQSNRRQNVSYTYSSFVM